MPDDRKMLYIKGDRNVEISRQEITLGDILSMECRDRTVIPKIRALRLMTVTGRGKQRFVVSVLKIISCIQERYPEIEVQNLGESDIIITYTEQRRPAMLWHLMKAAFVALVTFFGAVFSIMAFNNDVDVTRLFAQLYEFATGKETSGFTVLEISYSVGLAAGILIFFNHFGRKRFTSDPTPMEVQMRLYENDIQTTLIECSGRKGEEINVGGSDTSGSCRD